MDGPYNTTRRIFKNHYRRKGKNHKRRPKLKYVQQILKDQRYDSYVQMKRKSDDRESGKFCKFRILNVKL